MMKILVSVFVLASLAFVNCELTLKQEKPAVTAGPVCELCTVVLTAAQSFLEQNKTEDEVLKFIEKQLCGKLGSLNATCVNYLEENGRQILYELSQKVDPSIVCHHMGLCAYKKVEPTPKLKPLIDSNSLNCTLCKIVFEQVQNLLQSNASEQQIIALIEKDLCNATGKMSELCKTIIDTYGPTILTFLAKGVDPEKVCELIGMCTKNSTVILQKLYRSLRENPLYCTVCEYAVQFLDVELKNNKTEAAVVSALDKVCKIAPASVRQQCDALVNSYGIYLVELLINFADPLKVCQAIKLC